MTFGNEFQKRLEVAMSKTTKDKAQELIKLGMQFGNGYAKVAKEISELPDNHQTIFIAGVLDGLLSATYETCSDEDNSFADFMMGLFSLSNEEMGLFSLSDEDLME